jgi:hypothetical protein
VIPRLVKLDAVAAHSINQPMLLRYAPAPATSQLKSERFRLSDPAEWIGEDGCHQVKNAERGFAIRLDPVP